MDSRTLVTLLLPIGVWAGVWPGPVTAGPFKCLQPNGSVLYQEGPCTAGTDGAELTLDPTPASRPPTGKAKDYSVEGQLKALAAERKKARRTRDKAPAEAHRAGKKSHAQDRANDRAKCAKNRAEVARWRQKARGTYRDRDEQEFREQKLAYYQALVDQSCAPDGSD